MRKLLPLVMVACSGCTIAFGALGGLSASSANKESRQKGQPETASVGARILVGALLGLVVDGIIINQSLEGLPDDYDAVP